MGGEVRTVPVGAVAACLGAAMLAGCSGGGGPVASVAPGQDSVSTKLGNLLAFNSTNAPPAPGNTANPAANIDCPVVQVQPGASSLRVASGQDAAGVRYQISIGDVARQCALTDGKLAVRVGVETNLVLGPAGAPGSYTAPLRVAIVRLDDEAVVASKVYRVGGAVGAAGPAQFTLVADALTVPYVNDHAADTYEVTVGIGEGAPERSGRRTRR